jgi:hypothetical protein
VSHVVGGVVAGGAVQTTPQFGADARVSAVLAERSIVDAECYSTPKASSIVRSEIDV